MRSRVIGILGSMWSGKTQKLDALLTSQKREGRLVVGIDSTINTRQSARDLVAVAKDKYLVLVLKPEELEIRFDELSKYDVIGIDEYHLFSFSEPYRKIFLKFFRKLFYRTEATIYIAGLISDAKIKSFPMQVDLIPYLSDLLFLQAQCDSCLEPDCASYHLPLGANGQQIHVGSDYAVFCPLCFRRAKRNGSIVFRNPTKLGKNPPITLEVAKDDIGE